jgi:hypothetical protein
MLCRSGAAAVPKYAICSVKDPEEFDQAKIKESF